MVNWRLSSLTSKGSTKLGLGDPQVPLQYCIVSQSQRLYKKEGPSEI